jgi:signal peptidase II
MSGLARRSLVVGLALALVVLAADQLSKLAILHLFRPDALTGAAPLRLVVLPVLDFVLVWNRGVSFSLGDAVGAYGPILFTVLSLVIVVCLMAWLAKGTGRWATVALGLVVGGAVGNMIDRLRFGVVEDFLYVHIGAFDWFPVFNVGDSAISVGATMLVLESLFATRSSIKNTP